MGNPKFKAAMSSPTQTSVRNVLRLLHLWLGLILCIPLVLLGVTGTILTFQDDFSAATHAQAGTAQPIAAIIAAAATAAPEGQRASMFIAPAESGLASVRFAPAGGGAGRGGGGPGFGSQITVDPVSLATTASARGSGFTRTIHQLHGSLLITGRTGRSIVGWLGVVMLTMGVTGLVIWWPRPGRWAAAFKVGKGAKGVRLHRELHGAVGIWALIVFIVVSFSGTYIAFPETVAAIVSPILPGAENHPGPPPSVEPVKDATPIDADQAVTLATAAVPGTTLRSIGLPTRRDQPYRVSLAHGGSGEGAPAVTVFVDPWAASTIEIRDPAAGSLGSRLMAWQRPAHAGEGLGIVWHILVGLSGLLPLLFSITGIAMWWMKRRAKQRIVARTQALQAAE